MKYNVNLDKLLDEAMEVRPGLMAAKKKAEAEEAAAKAAAKKDDGTVQTKMTISVYDPDEDE